MSALTLSAEAQRVRDAFEHVKRRLQMDIDDGSRPDQWSMEDLVRKIDQGIAALTALDRAALSNTTSAPPLKEQDPGDAEAALAGRQSRAKNFMGEDKREATLAMMIRRLCSRRLDGTYMMNDELRDHALELLKSMDLLGSPLRQSASGTSQASDAEMLDWLDAHNIALNAHYGTNYGWKVVRSPNVTRVMTECRPVDGGHLADVDLHDSQARGFTSVRAAIRAAMAKEKDPHA